MVILLTAYLYKKFGHRLKLNGLFQKRGHSMQLQPVIAQNCIKSAVVKVG